MGTILKNLIPARSLDKNGVPVMVGDLLKVYHFTAIRKRKVYMYKIVADLPGQGVRALDAIDVATKGAQKAHSCPLHLLGEYEVIDGPTKETEEGELLCWWERKAKCNAAASWSLSEVK